MSLTDQEFKELFSRDDGAMLLKLMYAQHQELLRQSRKLFDYSHPVDEYQWGNVPADGEIIITPNWQIPERIENITVSLPVGITGATLRLGDRQIPLYQGTATTAQTLVSLPNLGIVLEETSLRQLTFTGAATSPFYVALSGHCLERTSNQ